MASGIITILLPLALAIIMVGLGLELTPRDFARVTKHPQSRFNCAILPISPFSGYCICSL